MAASRQHRRSAPRQDAHMSQALALFGPGDFSDWSPEVFHAVSRGGPALVLSFGVVPMGEEFVPQLRKMATDHLDAVGIDYVAVLASASKELDQADHLSLLADAGFVYMQGGSASYIAGTLLASRFFAEAIRLDVPWVGTSGGTMAAGDHAPDTSVSPVQFGPGLAMRPGVTFAAHWDTFPERFEGFREGYEKLTQDSVLVAIDEDTAVVDRGGEWTVFGTSAVHLRRSGAWQSFTAGQSLYL